MLMTTIINIITLAMAIPIIIMMAIGDIFVSVVISLTIISLIATPFLLRYYYKLGQTKMKDNEIPVSKVNFTTRNCIDSLI